MVFWLKMIMDAMEEYIKCDDTDSHQTGEKYWTDKVNLVNDKSKGNGRRTHA